MEYGDLSKISVNVSSTILRLMDRSLMEHHLWYEIKTLVDISKLLIDKRYLSNIQTPGVSEVVGNALLESYLLHLRNLKDFLWETRSQDDIIAEDFCTGWVSWTNSMRTDTLAGLDIHTVNRRINKQISHLTAARTRKGEVKTRWNVKKITCDLIVFLRKFLAKVDSTKMIDKYKVLIEQEITDFESSVCGKNLFTNYTATATTAVTITLNLGSPIPVIKPQLTKQSLGPN